MKAKTAKKNTKSPPGTQKETPASIPGIWSMGRMILEYEISMTQKEMTKWDIEIDTLESLSTIKFLKDIKTMWNRIQWKSTNLTWNTLFYINKTSKKKIPIEYIVYSFPILTEEEHFLKEVIQYVNDIHGIYFNESDILPFDTIVEFNLTIFCSDLNKKKVFSLGQAEKQDKPKISRSTPFMKSPWINSNSESALSKMIWLSKAYDYFYVNFDDVASLNEENMIPWKEFTELIQWIKEAYGTTIVMTFNKLNESITNTKSNEESEVTKTLFTLFYLTDVFISDEKAFFENMNYLFSFYQSEFQMDIKFAYTFWEQEIASAGWVSARKLKAANKSSLIITSKLLCTFTEFNSINITELNNSLNISHYKFDFKPFPRVNYSNTSIIEQYKNKLMSDKKYYLSVFTGGFLSKYCKSPSSTSSKGIEFIYPAYLTGLEITKRIVEINMLEFPTPYSSEFYKVKIDQDKLQEYIEQYNLTKKEEKFKLDCTNSITSKLKIYYPLIDNNINRFLSSPHVKKTLKNKGFIDANDRIVYDPVYRNALGPSCNYEDRHHHKEEIINKILHGNNLSSSNGIVPLTELKIPTGVKKKNNETSVNVKAKVKDNQIVTTIFDNDAKGAEKGSDKYNNVKYWNNSKK